MGSKFCSYKIPLPLNEVWSRTLTFWGGNRGTVKEKQITDNHQFGIMTIKHKATGTSWGETYKLALGYNAIDSMTYVSVEISLAWGSGLQWLKPKSLMVKWAQEMGVPPAKLVKKLDKNVSDTLDNIWKQSNL